MSPDDVMEVARLKGRVIALEAQVQTLEAEAKVYEAMRRAFAKSDSQEVTRLKAEVDKWQSWANAENAEKKVLKAEVERLRKAGDAMVELLVQMDVIMDMDSDHPEVEAWNAAKEGKPPSV